MALTSWLATREVHCDSCQWSASGSTATPSEAGSSEASPRHAESAEELGTRSNSKSSQNDARDDVLGRWADLEMDDGPLGEIFADSDGEVCPTSPSKSARRRMRRRRQREAIKAAKEPEHVEVVLDEIGFGLKDCSAKAEETPQAVLVTTPMHKAPRTPGVLSTNPCLDSPASGVSSP